MNLLLVDDEDGIREGLAAILRLRGHVVRTAESCARATELLDTEAFDLIVCDWRLGDGEAQSFLDGRDVPAVVSTGHAEMLEHRRPESVIEVLAKPVPPDQLVALVARLDPTERRSGTGADDEGPASSQPTDLLADLPADTCSRIELLRRVVAGDGALASVDVCDDGVVVQLRFALPSGRTPDLGLVESVAADFRVLTAWSDPESPQDPRVEDGQRVLEVRVLRNGAPEGVDTVADVARPDTWPAEGGLGLDCAGFDGAPRHFLELVERASDRATAGHPTTLLNLPDALRLLIECTGTGHAMPMRGTAGPSLPDELAALWR